MKLTKSQLLIPGLIDTHIHAPQYPNAGLGYDKQLLDWLQTYTFPLEKKFSDLEFAEKVYRAVVVSNYKSFPNCIPNLFFFIREKLWIMVQPPRVISLHSMSKLPKNWQIYV